MANFADIWQCQVGNCGYIYNPDQGDRKHKMPVEVEFWELNLRISPMIGDALSVVQTITKIG